MEMAGTGTTQDYVAGVQDAAREMKCRPMLNQDGSVSMEGCIANLLSVLGIDVPAAESDVEFKQNLAHSCMSKIRDLAQGKGSSSSGGGSAKTPPTNPLIDQVQKGAGAELKAMYMSHGVSPTNTEIIMARAMNAAFATDASAMSEQTSDAIAESLARKFGLAASIPSTSGGKRV
jgi:hypothetical protein